MNLKEIYEDKELLEVGRLAVQEVLLEWRDMRLSVMRNNGLVIKEKDGKDSHIIRMGPEDAIRIGLEAIERHLAERARGRE